ncbi:hypothetical protein D0Z70_15750 [Sphingobium terrigena]|uniref:Uncharacterized protein n=1 Tax=Sphingobium terrigena TaxID=2304063 RepID=A0A418YPX5_9SPHN|nr:hypothetical protein [Sphingobium terrigena]RJG53472.1 hypothetical protein D0Z70_15750 [Sphingobium terrigena]
MQSQRTAPGIAIAHTDDDVVIRVNRQHAMPILSILLHSKFADGPRIDFLTTPYVNALIEALIEPAGLAPTNLVMDRADLNAPIRLVEEWALANGRDDGETMSMLREATYPYTVKGIG